MKKINPPQLDNDFLVVAIGASAGGLKAVHDFFDAMADSPGMAFILVQHLAPNFKSLMPELLASHTKMEIFVAEENQEIKPNCIYLNNKDKNLGVNDGKFTLLEKATRKQIDLPIDIIFQMVAREYKENAIGVILSGTGSDGSKGLYDLKEQGGTILVQSPESAEFDGMPKSAIQTNCVDFILSPGKIAENIVWLASQDQQLVNLSASNSNSIYDKILTLLYKTGGVDFKKYKPNTLIRRMNKRMSYVKTNTLDDYFRYLLNHEDEIEILSQSFLIGVTTFFRNPEAFLFLKHSIIPKLCQQKKGEDTIRIWVPGCASGKEVYTLAILFDEYIQEHKLNLKFKIFGSDINKESLKKASSGEYIINDAAELNDIYLTNYFIKKGDRLQVIKKIREKIIFSYHDLTSDPPYIQIDLISCRNLLIYLNKEAKESVFKSFEFSLNKNGYLFLGNSESLGKMSQAFKLIDAKNKIYKIKEGRMESKKPTLENKTIVDQVSYLNANNSSSHRSFASQKELLYYKHLCKKHVPVTVYINENYDLTFMMGDFKKWFQSNDGLFTNNLLHLIPEDLAILIRNGVRRVKQSGNPVTYKAVNIHTLEGNVVTNVLLESVTLEPEADPMFLIQFGEGKEIVKAEEVTFKNEDIPSYAQQRITDLEFELGEKNVLLDDIREELETSNEELQSSNEELMSSNEELQSSNEELQSVNEELYTVNTELQEKNKELEALYNDMDNLLNSTDIGTLFLDDTLNIRKFTPAITKIFEIEEQDEGRSIAKFSSFVTEEVRADLLNKCKTALSEFKSFEFQLADTKNNFYLVRVGPFVTKRKQISGVVITFVNINDIKNKEAALELKTAELTMAQNIAKLGSWTLDLATNQVSWSEQLFDIYGLDPALGVPNYDDENHKKLFTKASTNKLEQAVQKTIETGEPYSLELRLIRKDGTQGWLFAHGRAVKDTYGNITHLQGIAQDITDRKELRSSLQKAKEFTSKITELSPSGIYIYDMEKGVNIYMNDGYTNILGYTSEDIAKLEDGEFFALFHPEDRASIEKHISKVAQGQPENKIEYRFRHKNGKYIWCYSIDSPFEFDDQGNVKSFFGVFLDITEKKKTEERLKKALKDANSANIYKNQFLANMSHEIRTPLNGLVGFSNLLRDHDLDIHEKKEYIDIIENCSKQLLNLVDDIIDLSKIEAGELDMNFTQCELNHLVKELELTFREIKRQQEKDQVEIIAYTPNPNQPINIKTDPNRLKQVLINLIGNALKFTDKGHVKFGYQIEGDFVMFRVTDTGIGITEDKLKLIFERFERVNPSNTDKYSGKGLGLSISKGIIGLLGGEIKVESVPGQGSTFSFIIPYSKTKPVSLGFIVKETPDYKALFKDQRVLVVDDNRINRQYLKTIFKRTTLIAAFADSGEEAISMFKKDDAYDIVLMDIRMPNMDGFQAKNHLLEINPNTKIIAQTAHAMSNDREQCLEKGFVDYIPKPLGKDDLFEVLAKWI
ncbi:chemotaxis protein CheB [Flavobacterium sp. ASW18X]|uniref:chemotaxis protein CheB n=1 Tax=Flavobacterium sp. ASW18X TaxID=2572595 RepID=UPI0010ADFB00|nr:chemotaxis protein CheB [Flavobacterium sp. ASW18X]TKD63539.1 PAS domain S-box protein [Flavobacterium sp. ASW18X]